MNSSDQALADLNSFIAEHEAELMGALLLLFSRLKKEIKPDDWIFIREQGYFPALLMAAWGVIIADFTEQNLVPLIWQDLDFSSNAEAKNRLTEAKAKFKNQLLEGIKNNLDLLVKSGLPPELWPKVLTGLWGLNTSQFKSGLNYYKVMLEDGAKLTTAERNLQEWAKERKDYRAGLIASYFLAETFNQSRFASRKPGTLLVWVTAHDERVCPACKPMNGRIVSEWEAPPAHLNCRCSVRVLR